MDRKSLIILVVCFGLLLTWPALVNKLYPPKVLPKGATNTVAAATSPLAVNGTNGVSSNAVQTVAAGVPAQMSAVAPPAFQVPASTPEITRALEDGLVRYTFTSHGGGLKLVELKRYPETVTRRSRKEKQPTEFATLNLDAPAPAFATLGGPELQGDNLFQISGDASKVRAEKSLGNGLHLVREFTIATNHVVNVVSRIENRSAQALSIGAHETIVGTSTPLGPKDDATAMGMMWFDGTTKEAVDSSYFGGGMGCSRGPAKTEYVGGESNVVWAAVHNQFFTMAAVPKEKAQRVVARRVDLPPPAKEELAADPKIVARPFGFQTSLLYPAAAIAPGQALEHRYQLYAGPKEYRLLAQLGSQMGNKLDLVMNFDGFFGFFAKALLLSMNGLYSLFGGNLGYGWIIILITVLIKLLFWPLTQASTRSMKRMSELQPQMKALQEKYKDDPKKMNVKLMEFMKENRVNPMGGCLPILVQIPIFFGFFTMLRSAIELRGASFLWAFDLSQPDTIFTIPGLGWLPVVGIPGQGFPINPLPLLMGVTQFFQARMTPPSPGMDPMQQKMMQYMPLFFLVILYNYSAGLALYWTVQNLLTILQMKLTKTGQANPAGVTVVPPRRK
jgi:YidC/Oxa1 family membrane protein insertase